MLRSKFFILGSLFLLISCSQKKEINRVQLSANRTMGLIVRSIKDPSGEVEAPQTREYITDLYADAVQELYGAKLRVLQLPGKSLIENPTNLFAIANLEIDDLFVVEVKTSEAFSPPPNQPTELELDAEGQPLVEPSPQSVELSTTVYNGAKLRTVTVFQFSVTERYLEPFEKSFVNAFEKSAKDNFPDPNIYPASDPAHFANLLYNYSQQQERLAGNLNCTSARKVLLYYDRARVLFEKAEEKAAASATVGQQEEAYETKRKVEESKEKAEILRICKADEKKTFEIDFDFANIEPAQADFIREAFKTAKLGKLLSKYTNKPVKLQFSLDEGSSDINLTVFLRYDPQLYKAWTKGRVPRVAQGYHIISLSPYDALFKQLVYFRTQMPPEAPQQLQRKFRNMSMTLVLNTLLNGRASIGVDGSFVPEEKAVSLASPNALILKLPTYDEMRVATRSQEIFNEKGWLAFSGCKTIDGTITEDGLVMKFFGLPCKL